MPETLGARGGVRMRLHRVLQAATVLAVAVMLAGCGAQSRVVGEWENASGATLKFTKSGDFVYHKGDQTVAGSYKAVDGKTVLFTASNVSWATGVPSDQLTTQMTWGDKSTFTFDDSVDAYTVFESLNGDRRFSKRSSSSLTSGLMSSPDHSAAQKAVQAWGAQTGLPGDPPKFGEWRDSTLDEWANALGLPGATSSLGGTNNIPKIREGFAQADTDPKTRAFYFKSEMRTPDGKDFTVITPVVRLTQAEVDQDPSLKRHNPGDWAPILSCYVAR